MTDNTTGGRIILDPGRGTEPGTVTLSEACQVGDLLGISSATWVRANATVTAIQARAVALRAGASGDIIPVSANPVVGGLSGMTVGGVVYASMSAGQSTQTAPTSTSSAQTIIGIALSATDVMFFINSRADSVSTS